MIARLQVAVDGVWIGNWIYQTQFVATNKNYGPALLQNS
jgi:hypothetical protein